MKAALYVRVSTDGQATENQVIALRAAAEHRGWEVAHIYEDAGISGSKGRDKRPGLDRMLKDAVRGRFSVVMCWSVDRLGRSLQDLLATMQELHGARVDLFLHQQAIDTTTPAGRAMFGMMGVFAEFERSLIQERVRAGLARARAKGVRLGKPPVAAAKVSELRALIRAGTGVVKAGRIVGCGTSVAQRVRDAMRAENAGAA